MRQKNTLTITFLRGLIEKRTKQINAVIDEGLYTQHKDKIADWFDDITQAEISILKMRRDRIFKNLDIKK